LHGWIHDLLAGGEEDINDHIKDKAQSLMVWDFDWKLPY
jgi:hypothetical protein